MDRVVQENASLVAEQAAAAEHLARLSARLIDSVARFRLDPGAAAPAAAHEPAAGFRAAATPARAAHLKLVPRPQRPEEARSVVQ